MDVLGKLEYPPLEKGGQGGFARMLKYNPRHKTKARSLLAFSRAEYDKRRSEYLEQRGLRVLRFDDRQVLLQIESVA